MMSVPSVEKNCIRSERAGEMLEVRFQESGDRQSHTITLYRDGKSLPLLKSLEGDDQMSWPPSPPLQQLSTEPREGGAVALLVGMAGRSHWSLSVEALADGQLRFEAACRLHRSELEGPESSRWLGSTYQILYPELITESDSTGIGVVCDASSPSVRSIEDSDQWTIRPAKTDAALATWTYAVRF